jgi:hypothetical protein
MVAQGVEFLGGDVTDLLSFFGEALAAPSGPIPCAGGTGSVATQDVAPSGISAGDTATLTFNNCVLVIGPFALTARGQVTLTATTYNLIPPSGSDIEISYTFRNFEVDVEGSTITLNGNLVLGVETPDGNVRTIVARGSSLNFSVDGQSRRLTNFRHEQISDELTGDYTLNIEGTVQDSSVGGAVDYTTDVLFSGTDPDDPDTGEASAEGAAASALRIEVLDDVNVRIHVDEDGDGTEESSIDTTWAELLGEIV